jgi:single-strand DNA-binding protein
MNKVLLMGRLTKDPEVRYTTTNNTLVCGFTLAVNRRFAKEGEQQADFINIVAWNKLGEFCSKYFAKGQQVALCGRIQTRTYDDKDGKKVYVTEVVAEEAYFADTKKQDDFVKQDTTFTVVEGDSDLPF